MIARIRRILFGSPLPSWRAMHEKLPKILALPILASDALSSVAYATEEILIVLLFAGSLILHHPYVFYISGAIVTVLVVVSTSYRQTVHAYPSGGGAYTVAKENIGITAGLTAGAALAIGYILTVSVSIAAGTDAIISANPLLSPYRIELCIAFVALITLGNLRGVRESGLAFAAPTYIFIVSIFTLIIIAIFRLQTTGLTIPSSTIPVSPAAGISAVTLFLILRAFSGGCAAMTGTEAISNAVPAFKPPESKNAASTLAIMAGILGVMFIGVSYIAWKTQLIPLKDIPGVQYETVISQIASATFGRSWFYYLIQYGTTAILILAANTSFAGFPRLASVMARDRYLPRQFYNVGDRLVFSNGIIVLALLAALLIVVFKGDTHKLIPLYALGVFLSFTLSQTGMVKRFNAIRPRGWQWSALVSGIGAVVTGVVTVVLAVVKFTEGSFVVVILIPVFVLIFYKMNSHYVKLGNQLRLTPEDKFVPLNNTVLVLTPSIHRGVLHALEYAKGLSADVRAIHIETDPLDTALLLERWETWGGGIPLVILESPYRSIVGPLLDYLEEAKQERKDYVITVVVPELAPVRWWHSLLHNQTGLMIKFALLFRRDIIVTNVRYFPERTSEKGENDDNTN